MTNKIGRPVKIEPEGKICKVCNKLKNKKEFRLSPISTNPNLRRNQCNICRNKQIRDRNKKTGYWKKKYNAMSDNDRAAYIKKASERCQLRLREKSGEKERRQEYRKRYNKSDKAIYNRYRCDCKVRGKLKREIKMLITFEEFSELINKSCIYCGDLSRGVDRVDSELSYTVENSVSCCKICNCMKNNLTVEEFIAHINKIQVKLGVR